MSIAATCGIGLGLADSLFFVCARKAYDMYIQSNRLNSKITSTDIWQYILYGSLIGSLTPIGYLWAAYYDSGLIDIHLYRCLVSALLAVVYSYYVYKDSINGYRLIGMGMATIGLAFVLFSTMFAY